MSTVILASLCHFGFIVANNFWHKVKIFVIPDQKMFNTFPREGLKDIFVKANVSK